MMGEHMKQKFQVYLCVWPKQCMAKTQLSLDSVQYAVVQTEIEKTALPKNLKMLKIGQKNIRYKIPTRLLQVHCN